MSTKNSKTIAEKRAELAELLAWFEGQDFVLEDAITKFEKAEVLAREIEEELMQYKNKITVLKQRFDQVE